MRSAFDYLSQIASRQIVVCFYDKLSKPAFLGYPADFCQDLLKAFFFYHILQGKGFLVPLPVKF